MRTFIPSDLKSRIDGCQKRCAALKDDFYNRLNLDTNTQVKKIRADLLQTGTFLLGLTSLVSNLFTGIGRTLEVIKDDKLGTVEFLLSSIIKNNSTSQRTRLSSGYHRLTAPGIGMKRTGNVKPTLAPGSSKANDSLGG